MAMAFSLEYSALWTCILYIIKPKNIGKAYGLLVASQNMGFVVVPMIISLFNLDMRGYIVPQRIIITISILTFITTLLIYFEDRKLNNILDKSNIYYPR